MRKSIQEIYSNWSLSLKPFQMVLKFSNDADVVITGADMEQNSKFIRRSKRRLGESFELAGYLVDGEIVDEYQAGCGEFWRTYTKGKCDYFLYVSNDFQLIENVKRRSYKKDKERTDETIHQVSYKDIIPPDVEKVVDLYVTHDGRFYSFEMESPLFRKGEKVASDKREYKTSNLYVGQYMATIYGLRTVLKNSSMFDKVRIHPDNSLQYAAGVYKLPMKKWRPFNKECQSYVDEFLRLKEELALNNVSIVFSIERGGAA